jgi:hypothetical protein
MKQVLIDENLSESPAKGLDMLQQPLHNGIKVTSIAAEFHRGIKDEDWIPVWGARSGVFITQDLRIRTTRQQATLLVNHKLGAFFLKTPKGYKYWDKMLIILKHWPEIVKIIQTKKPPYVYIITQSKVGKA